MGSRLRALLAVIVLLMLCGGLPSAAAEPREVTVATHDLVPFVVTHDNVKSGFSIDLWEEIAKRQQWTTRYVDVPDVAEQLRAVTDRRADVAAGAISITAQRTQSFDFSQPILNAGLQIAVPAHAAEASPPGLRNFLHLLFSTSMLVWLLAALAITVLPAHITWLIERRHADSMVAKSYIPGVLQAFAWGLGALAAQADDAPRHWLSRAMATLWAFVSIIFIAYYTATLTASLTVQKFEAQIAGPADLFGKKVATVANTTSAAFLQGIGVTASDMPTIEDCFAAMRDKGYDAVVFDSPVLRYWVSHEGSGFAQIAGPIFQTEDYGLALRNGSELRKRIDQSLLLMREDGTYNLIKQKWFGTDDSSATNPN